MGPDPLLRVEHRPLADLRRAGALPHDALALIRFDDPAAPAEASVPTPEGIEITRVHAPLLGTSARTMELWRLDGPLQSGRVGRVHYRRHERLLFAAATVAAAEFAAADPAHALRCATALLYTELFAALAHLGYPHPLRIWNFLPEITGAAGDGERYWHFNAARQDAFRAHRRTLSGQVPAATAVGTRAGTPLTLYCIAGVDAPLPLENPRQRSAWNYPPQYGPRSPTFSRACLENGGRGALFISGTASILGHETVHAEDATAQTLESVRNIHALLDAANARVDARRYALADLHFRIYVRHAAQQPQIESVLRAQLGAVPMLFVHADLCRRDLLVEIEAFGA